MAARVRVQCIVKSNRSDPHERILFIGGKNSDESRWSRSQPQAIIDIESGTYQYYVHVGNNTVNVIVATHNGHKYIKTENDGIQPDNLLALPQCPV